MAITREDQQTGTGSGSVVLNFTALQNDVVYAFGACQQTSDSSWSASAGWTQLADLYSNDTLDVNLVCYRKVMGGVPDTSVTLDGSTGTSRHVGVVIVLRGVDTTTPEDVAVVTASAIDGGTPNPGSITPANNNCYILAAGATSETDTVTNAPPGYGNLSWINNSSDIAIMLASRLLAVAAAEDPDAFTDVAGQTSDSWCAITIAVRPATGGGGDQNVATNPAAETDGAVAIGKTKIKAINPASETDAAVAIAAARIRPVGVASETDTAESIGRTKTKALTPANENDSAQPIATPGGAVVGVASETDTAVSIGRTKTRLVGVASEADFAIAIGITGGVQPVAQGSLFDLGLLRRRRR